jgi:hypothetical protein
VFPDKRKLTMVGIWGWREQSGLRVLRIVFIGAARQHESAFRHCLLHTLTTPRSPP